MPADLVNKAIAMENRMQACCEYHLNDDPEMGPQLAALRAGHGHQDLATDLLGYAAIYRDHWDVLSADKKHFRATDADDAVKIAEEMVSLLGNRSSAEARQATEYVQRAFTLLLDTYDEVATTGRWLLRNDPHAEKRFPSLLSVTRSRKRRTKPSTAPAEG